MKSIALDAVDLNLLRVFSTIYEERSVTRASARLGIGQPATSAALARLRQLFADPLFIRTKGAMLPTPRARQIGAAVAEAMARLRSAIEPDDAFEPSRSRRSFRLSMSDYGEALLLPTLARTLQRDAPGLSLRVIRTRELFRAPDDALESGSIDLAIGFFSDVRPRSDPFFANELLRETFVCVARRNHPRIRRRLTLSAFLELAHVRVMYPEEEDVGVIDTILARQGKKRVVALTVPHFTTALPIVGASDLLAMVPERLARAMCGRYRLQAYSPPIEVPWYSLSIAWHERAQHDAAHTWLRGAIGELAATHRK